MARDEKNVKDLQPTNTNLVTDNLSYLISYSKTDRLVMALYMVTDVMDREEPLRLKLRKLGADILSDMNSRSRASFDLKNTLNRLNEILSFLNLAETMSLVSAMNSAILKKEFFVLKEAVSNQIPDQEVSFMELLKTENTNPEVTPMGGYKNEPKRHKPINLGMQRAGNFMTVLSNRVPQTSNRNLVSDKVVNGQDFKQTRRDEILKVIKYKNKRDNSSEGLTITDILSTAKEAKGELGLSVLFASGEKTLQRELVSLVKENILHKTGSKRWSKYSI